jgi:hypothetical protein
MHNQLSSGSPSFPAYMMVYSRAATFKVGKFYHLEIVTLSR